LQHQTGCPNRESEFKKRIYVFEKEEKIEAGKLFMQNKIFFSL